MSNLSKFRRLPVQRGVWVHDASGASIHIDEDYCRTFRAYWAQGNRLSCDVVVRNKAGNPLRFRSSEAAATYLLKHLGE